jgi:hypothetical protein
MDFSKGQFRIARSDENIVQAIQKGVPNGGMPPGPHSEAVRIRAVFHAFVQRSFHRTGGRRRGGLSGDAEVPP